MNNTESIGFSGPPGFVVLANSPIVVFLYRYGLALIFLLGFAGNAFSMMTFLRPVLRVTSTGFLFFILAVSDTSFLLVQIYDFIEVGITQTPVFLLQYHDLCRLRWFAKGVFQFCSAWVLALVAIDRWFRARLPFKVNVLCTHQTATIALGIIFILGCCLHVHLLIPSFFGALTPGIATEACGPVQPFSMYGALYFGWWPIIQAIVISIVPVLIMLISGFDVYYIIRLDKNRVRPAMMNQIRRQRHERLQGQMLLLTLASITVFFLTTLPISIRRAYGAYQTTVLHVNNIYDIVMQNGILTVVACLNYGINFYVHCMASNLFRREFIQQFQVKRRIHHKVTPTPLMELQRVAIGVSTTN